MVSNVLVFGMNPKFLITLLLASLTLLSCNRVEPVNKVESYEIKFGNLATRVNSVDEINEFSVWSAIYNETTTSGTLPLLENERVYRNSDSDWTYDNTRFWLENSDFYFLASYPYMENGGFTSGYMEDNGAKYIYYLLDITTPQTADLDILTATNYTNTADVNFSPNVAVPLMFNHLMTKVNIKIAQDFDKNTDDDFIVTKITLSGIKNRGQYIALPLSGGFLTLWEMSNSTATFEKVFDTPVNLRELKGNYYPVWGETGLLLIPQAIGSQAVKVTVDYLYHMKDTEGEGEARFIEATLPASDLWQSGNAISYTLKISETHEIIFQTPKVESWGAPQSGGTIIIK